MNSPLSYVERGGVPPKVRPMADLVINPQRGYSADSPSNAELVQFADQVGQGPEYIKSVMDSPLSYIERGGVPPKVVPVADLVINPQRAYSADESSSNLGLF